MENGADERDLEVGFPPEDDLEHLIEDYSHLAPPSEGELLQGHVVKITPTEAIVDVGYKLEGVVPIEQLRQPDGSVAFKAGPMRSYLEQLDLGIAKRVALWRAKGGEMLVYPAMKQLTLDLAATSFLGADIGPEVQVVTTSFIDMVAAAVAPIRVPIPGTQMARGVQGRKRIVEYFSKQIPLRRGNRRSPVRGSLRDGG